MTSRLWYPHYPGDYIRDTRHLTLEEHGAYRLLMDWYWDHGPLKDDSNLLRLLRSLWAESLQKTKKIWKVLADFFVKKDGFFYLPRMDEIITKSERIHEVRSRAGRRGNAKRWSHMLSQAGSHDTYTYTEGSSNELPLCSSNELHSMSGKKPIETQKGQGNRMAAERIIGFLNQTAGRHFKTTDANCEPVIARFKEGYTESDCRAVIVRRWRAWKDDDKMIGYMRPATLFNRTKFNQYAGEIEPEEE